MCVVHYVSQATFGYQGFEPIHKQGRFLLLLFVLLLGLHLKEAQISRKLSRSAKMVISVFLKKHWRSTFNKTRLV